MRGRSAFLGVAFAALASAAAARAADTVVRISVTVPEGPVTPGKAFPVTVVRSWPAGWTPRPFSEDDLLPLVARTLDVTVASDGGREREERRLLAWLFARETVEGEVPPFSARPPDGTAAEVAEGGTWRVPVAPEVDAAAPGKAELPREPFALEREGVSEPRPWRAALVLAVAAAIGGALLLARARGRANRGAEVDREPSWAALRLAAERGEPVHALLATRVRDHVGRLAGVDARARSTDELVVAARDVLGRDDAGVVALLAELDRARFSARAPSPAEALAAVDRVRRLVAEGAP